MFSIGGVVSKYKNTETEIAPPADRPNSVSVVSKEWRSNNDSRFDKGSKPNQMSFIEKEFTLVFAHPDDEVLWASSVIKHSKKIVICFSDSPGAPNISEQRKRAMLDFPLKSVENLGLEEINAIKRANWRRPKVTPFGIFHRKNFEKYKAKYHELYRHLGLVLSPGDVVITHNPWGEYGHEEHVVVHNVIAELKKKLSLEVYVTGYVSNRSLYAMELTRATIGRKPLIYPTNESMISILSTHYKNHCAWTWWDDYQWPSHESFFLLEENRGDDLVKSSSELMSLIIFNEHTVSFRDILKYLFAKILFFFR